MIGEAPVPGEPLGLSPISITGLPVAGLTEWLAAMLLIREFETACEPLALSAKLVSGVHSSAGQEAVAVGSIRALQPRDLVFGPHRSHHHALAKGLDARSLMAELYGRSTGCTEGRGGTMHLRDIGHGYLGGNGIVGGSVGLGLGAALASAMRGDNQVTVAYIGDGATNTGRTWESVNLAAVWRVPLIVICENNLYAVETTTARMTGGGSITRRAEGFGLPVESLDGQDVGAVYRATKLARERASRGEGPTFLEARTYRYEGHQSGERVRYRTNDEVLVWRASRDPIERLRSALESEGLLAQSAYEMMVATAKELVAASIAFADTSPWPHPADALMDVTGTDLRLEGNA